MKFSPVLEANLQKIDINLSRPSITAERTLEREKFLSAAETKHNGYSYQNPSSNALR
jgi:hypothetical protein